MIAWTSAVEFSPDVSCIIIVIAAVLAAACGGLVKF
jgi:hypothetical protein